MVLLLNRHRTWARPRFRKVEKKKSIEAVYRFCCGTPHLHTSGKVWTSAVNNSALAPTSPTFPVGSQRSWKRINYFPKMWPYNCDNEITAVYCSWVRHNSSNLVFRRIKYKIWISAVRLTWQDKSACWQWVLITIYLLHCGKILFLMFSLDGQAKHLKVCRLAFYILF